MKRTAYLIAYCIAVTSFAALGHADSDTDNTPDKTMAAPSIGYMHDPYGRWRAVNGVSGSFVLGPALRDAAIALIAQPGPASPNAVEQRGDFFYIVDTSGATLDILPPEARGPVLLTASAVIYATGDSLVFRYADAPEVRLDCAGVATLRSMSADWVQVTTAMQEYALRITPGREALFLLPTAPRELPEPGARRR